MTYIEKFDGFRVVVNSASDLPTPVGGVITLAQNTAYVFVNINRVISITDIIEFSVGSSMENANISTTQPIRIASGANMNTFNCIFTYSGAGTLLQATELSSNSVLDRTSFISLGGGQVFDLTSTSDGIFFLDRSIIFGGALGTMEGILFVIRTSQFLSFTTGFDLTNMLGVDFGGVQFQGTNQTTTFLEFLGTSQGLIQISALNATLNTNETLYDFNDTGVTYDGIIAANGVVEFTGGADTDNVFASGSLDYRCIQCKFVGNVNIPDSKSKGNIFFQDSTTQTVIDQVEVPIKVNATYTTGEVERFTNGSSLTYTGLEDVSVNAICSLVIYPVTGTNILVGAYIAKTEADTFEVTFDNTTNTVNRISHGLSNGTSIRFSTTDTLPAEIRDDQFYWVVNAATDTFQVENLPGDGVHPFTDNGTGTHYYSLGEYIDSSESNTSPSSTRPFGTVTLAGVSLKTGDKIEVFVDNHDTTSNLIVSSLQLIIS